MSIFKDRDVQIEPNKANKTTMRLETEFTLSADRETLIAALTKILLRDTIASEVYRRATEHFVQEARDGEMTKLLEELTRDKKEIVRLNNELLESREFVRLCEGALQEKEEELTAIAPCLRDGDWIYESRKSDMLIIASVLKGDAAYFDLQHDDFTLAVPIGKLRLMLDTVRAEEVSLRQKERASTDKIIEHLTEEARKQKNIATDAQIQLACGNTPLKGDFTSINTIDLIARATSDVVRMLELAIYNGRKQA